MNKKTQIKRHKKVLILGGEGFIGRNLSDFLSKTFDCFSIDRYKSLFPGSKAIFKSIDPYNEKIPGNYEIIIHLIDNNVQSEEFEKLEKQLFNNLNQSFIDQIIIFSSAAIYAAPDSDYAKRKKLLESIYQDFCQSNKIGLSTIRMFNIFGPYQLPDKKGSLVANILYKYFSKELVEINDLHIKRDFMYSLDVARCIHQLIDKKIVGVHNLASNKMMSIERLIYKINQILSDEIKIINKNNKEEDTCPKASSKIVDLIKLTSMEQSLLETVNFYKNNWKLIRDNKNAK